MCVSIENVGRGDRYLDSMVPAVAPHLWWLAIADFLVYVTIDRAKTVVSHCGRWSPPEVPFRCVLGFDQLLHKVTNIVLAIVLVLL